MSDYTAEEAAAAYLEHNRKQYFATVYLDRHDSPAETAEQVMRATAGVLEAADRNVRVFMAEAETGSDSYGVVISTAKLSEEDATTLWQAYPYDEAVLEEWEQKGWKAVDGN
jgi:hypothetical protein